MNGLDLDWRRDSAGWYKKTRQNESRDASNVTAKNIKFFCSGYDKFYSLSYFNAKHHCIQSIIKTIAVDYSMQPSVRGKRKCISAHSLV